jgi:protein SCO1/2
MRAGGPRGIPETVLICALAATAAAQTGHEGHIAPVRKTETAAVGGLKIPDAVLLNERGEKVRFYSDLVKGKTVAINTIFTTCTTICPLMGANFAKVRKLIGERPDIRLISVSIDPVLDTPERLVSWQRGFGPAAPGWTLVTGDRAEVLTLLKALQVFTPDKLDHEPVVLMGGDGSSEWSRASALMTAPELAKLILSRASH